MNNNTKSRLLGLSSGRTVTFQIPIKVQGNHGPDYEYRAQTITKLTQPRISKRPKVAAQ